MQEDNPHASKKDDLSYSHADLHACTLRKAENGAKGDSATNGGHVPNDFDAVAEELAERGKDGPVYAEVRIRTFTPPAISAGPDDDLLDIDPPVAAMTTQGKLEKSAIGHAQQAQALRR